MDENVFWLRLWQTVGATIVCVVLSAGGCTAHTDYRIATAIEAGADPLAARCALSVHASGTDPVCVLKSK